MHGCTRAIGQRHAHSHGACLCQSCAHSSCVPARAGVPNASKCEGHRQNRQEAQEAGYRRELRSCGLLGPLAPVPASAGARHLKVRRHLLLRVLRRRASWTRSTPGAPLARPAPPLRAPQPPRPPHAPIPHLPAAARSRPCVRLRAQAPTIFQGVGRRRTRRTTSAAPTTPRPAVAAAVAPVAALVAASALAAPVAAPCSAPLF